MKFMSNVKSTAMFVTIVEEDCMFLQNFVRYRPFFCDITEFVDERMPLLAVNAASS